jgi:predicted amidohydrolase
MMDWRRSGSSWGAVWGQRGVLLLLAAVMLPLTGVSTMAQDSTEMEGPKPFQLALIQLPVEGGNRSKNLAEAEAAVARAVREGAQVVLLPEAVDLGWTHPSALSEAQPIPEGETCRRLSALARDHRVYVCSGLIEKDGGQVFNSAVLIDPQGRVVLRHRKINELEIGHPYYSLGDRLNVYRTEFGTIGLLICADAFAKDQALLRSLAYMGADVILSPSSWAVKADHDNQKEPYGGLWRGVYIPVAKEFSVWIASASNVGWMTAGPWEGWKAIGCSMVVDHRGEVVTSGPYGVDAGAILHVTVDPVRRPAQGNGWFSHWGGNR